EETLPAPRLDRIGAEHHEAGGRDEPRVRVMQRPPRTREMPGDEPGDRERNNDEERVEKTFGREQLPLYRQNGPYVVSEFSPARGSIRSEMPPSARVSSLGMTHTLFASPCAIFGSTCRYW